MRILTFIAILSAAGLGTHGMAQQRAEPALAPSPDAGAAPSEAAAAPARPATVAMAADPGSRQLQAELQQAIERTGWRDARWSVMVVSLDRGDTLYAYNAHERLAPASNMKLFTTAAGLYYLGSDYRYNTFLMATGPIRDGVLDGDLVVYGTGDPTFSARFGSSPAVWQAFADTLQALGVREVRGDIVGDGSYFAGSGAAEGWQESYMNAAYAANAGALSYTENVATLQVRPAEQAGWRPEIRLVPGGEGIAIVNQATTVASGRTSIQAARMAYDGPIVVRGQIARGSAPLVRTVPVSDPARYAAAIFREFLERRDIVVAGGVRSAMTEAESPVTGRSVFAPALDSQAPVRVLAVHTSPPIQQILDIINRRSHNMMAEQVLRTVGRVAVGEGSVAGGRRAIEHMMREAGHPSPEEIDIFDGSGLSILNRSSAHGLVSLLAVMAESPAWDAYWETLPEAGSAQGLRRMHQTPAAGNLRAKTGTIDRVSALSGYVTAANGERLAFAIISNNVPSTAMAKRIEDAIGGRLAGFDRPRSDGYAQAPADTAPAADVTAQRTEPVQPAEPAERPAAQPRTYTIRSGDTLDGIARRNSTTVAALERANPGINPRRLIPGRSINLPQ
ncbi:MAG TPA: D-alanyl-D-alanine carboxypeptidase/D-alanyl-D-alanine-endopeptidase [Longimicrobiales bacterium]|nr:D-alanyl-D-alanine carboxypeptidase/D-alanyl-D-alanine-endopeptidase [Longimicrobiales bacterium]